MSIDSKKRFSVVACFLSTLVWGGLAHGAFMPSIVSETRKIWDKFTGTNVLFEEIEGGYKVDLSNHKIDPLAFQKILRELQASDKKGQITQLLLNPLLKSPTEKDLGEEGVEQLAQLLPQLKALQVLSLSNCNMGKYNITVLIASIANLPQLKQLRLAYNQIDDKTAQALVGVIIQKYNLQALPHFKRLDLQGNQITEGKKKILGEEYFHGIRELNGIRGGVFHI